MKLCHILSHTAMAELHHMLASTHFESRRQCLETVVEVVNITGSFRDEDFNLLDPVMTVSIFSLNLPYQAMNFCTGWLEHGYKNSRGRTTSTILVVLTR